MSRLVIENVSREFPPISGNAPMRALQPINITVADNDFVTILGPSGCGKSTLLRIVAGLDHPTSGRVLLDDRPVTRPGPDRGMVFQSYTLFPWLTVAENVPFGLREKGITQKDRQDVSRLWLERVGLTNFADHYPKQLSGGMQQRTAIARALLHSTG